MTRPSRRRDLRSIDRELVREGLAALCEEMAVSILRTSHSETVKSAMDFSTAICDANGEIIAQGVTLPNQLGAIPDAADAILRAFGTELRSGDVIILNDPFAGGMHFPDVFMVTPIFWKDRVVAMAATVAHHADLGGMTAGSMSPTAEECHQEGLRIPPLKLYDEGRPNDAVFRLIRANSRVPDVVIGDLAAQLVSCKAAETGLLKLIDAYGQRGFWTSVRELLDYTEALTRDELKEIPDGTYAFADQIDNDGVHDVPVDIRVVVTVDGGSVDLDFAGSSPQVAASLNSTLSFTKSCAYAAIRSVLRSDIPDNGAFFRPITVRAPAGSIVHCVYPAATGTRGLTGFRVMDAIFGALAAAVPDRVMAASDGGLSLIGLSGIHRGAHFTTIELLSGAWGGRPDRDGVEGVPNLGANVSNIPVEMLEAAYPVRIKRSGYVADTGGAGRYRGGTCVEREYVFLSPTTLTVRSDRRDVLPYGIAGGADGTASSNTLRTADGETALPSKFSRTVDAGGVFYHRTAGAGGWGDPLDRLPVQVAENVRDGLLSVDWAARAYGVVIRPDGSVDDDATGANRAARRVQRPTEAMSRGPDWDGGTSLT